MKLFKEGLYIKIFRFPKNFKTISTSILAQSETILDDFHSSLPNELDMCATDLSENYNWNTMINSMYQKICLASALDLGITDFNVLTTLNKACLFGNLHTLILVAAHN